jgi:hypothetical protein
MAAESVTGLEPADTTTEPASTEPDTEVVRDLVEL